MTDHQLNAQLSACELLQRHATFAPLHHNIIEGLAIASPLLGETSFVPSKAVYTLPLPLLWSHCWETPLGFVVAARAVENELRFRARLANVYHWSSRVWEEIKMGMLTDVSIRGRILEPHDRRPAWKWLELSICERGTDPGTQIYVAKSIYRPTSLFFDTGQWGKTVVHRDVCGQPGFESFDRPRAWDRVTYEGT